MDHTCRIGVMEVCSKLLEGVQDAEDIRDAYYQYRFVPFFSEGFATMLLPDSF